VTSFYNDNAPFAVEWLRNLIRDGVIDDGVVDSRSVTEVSAADILGFRQCHFFAGIGGWAEAFQLAGLTGVDRVFSASLPCQPLSHAGKHKGAADKRHLWPEFYPIVSEFRPSAIFGEQSQSPDGREWIDGISLDLEEMGYAVAAADLPASSVGTPHRRQRMFWVAWLADTGSSEFTRWCQSSGEHWRALHAADSSSTGGMGHAARDNERRAESSGASSFEGIAAGRSGAGMGDAMFQGLEGFTGTGDRTDQRRRESQEQDGSATETGPWDDYRIAECADGKTRRVGTGVSPLAYGIPSRKCDERMGHMFARLRELGIDSVRAKRIVKSARANRKGRIEGYGNSIVPMLAAKFILAAADSIREYTRQKEMQ
jgi:DNA (cytosine-5)-methyltransferase 1